MRFIELTHIEGEPIVINVAGVLTIQVSGGHTELWMFDGSAFWVKETPDEIMIKIRG